ncbi:unnamed protein product [Candidula unifasciata]|uniref:Uncharacterized protein n=1 Tax=Candidula unifasciata TaxID=100452 RepID=A0A8S3ZXB4_9EUPU|nr:unnamed protein product [Candidula unifasciata]
MFLYGPPGSGKTLVLTLKAKQWLLAGRMVVLINSRPGSTTGFPYAYGISTRLIHMMLESKVPMQHLSMINIDPLNFQEKDLDSVVSSYCVIMDEVTPSSHKVIDSLCRRQVSNIWCAGLFHEDLPNTTQAFATHKMDKILRCPPVVQSVLRHTEEAVRLQKPYEKVYQRIVMEPEHSTVLNNDNYNKYTDTIQKSRVAYYSELQKGQREYNKSVTSMYSLLSHFRQFTMQVSNNPSQKYVKNSFRAYTSDRGQIVDNIWTKHSSFCTTYQKAYQSTKELRPAMGLLRTSEARQVYKQMFLLPVLSKDSIRKMKRDNSSCSDNKLGESSDLSKELLLKDKSSLDDMHVFQLARFFSDHFFKTDKHSEDSETCKKRLDEAIQIFNVYFLRKFNKELQIVHATSGTSQGANSNKPDLATSSTNVATDGLIEVSSDPSQQQQPTQHLKELNSARISTKMANDDKVTSLGTEKVKCDPESLNNRLILKYSSRCELKSTTAPVSESVPQDMVPQEVQSTFNEDVMHGQKSLEKRLAEKYGSERHVKSEISLQSNNAQFPFTIVSDSEALNKRLTEKYRGHFTETSLDLYQQEATKNNRLWQTNNQECSLTIVAATGSKTVSQELARHKIQSKFDGLKHDQKSLEKRLAEKYGSGRHATSTMSSLGCKTWSQFTVLTDSEALNKRLMEKYSGSFIKRPLDPCQREEKLKRSPYNTNTIMYGSRGQSNGLPLVNLTADNKYKISKNSYSAKSSSDLLNTRIQKYKRRNVQTPKQLTTGQFCDGHSHTEMSLPSDGPQPTIIDHALHSKTGGPAKCQECAHELFTFLNTMVRPDDKTICSKRKHNFYETKLIKRGSSERGHFLLSSTSPKGSFFQKPEVFESRALAWSDVVIVVEEMAEDSVFVKVLKSKNIPVEVCTRDNACRIEDPREKKLFITSYKETTGIERAIIVFIPSEKQVSSQQFPVKVSNIDLKLASCISRFSENDKLALWYVASRSLASLVLILP